jgi:hypothetical protein
MQLVRLIDFQHGIASVDPCVVFTKPSLAISKGRRDDVTKPDFRASGKQERARNFKYVSGESCLPSATFSFN